MFGIEIGRDEIGFHPIGIVRVIDLSIVVTPATATSLMRAPVVAVRNVAQTVTPATATAQANAPTVTTIRNVSQTVTPATATSLMRVPSIVTFVSIASPRFIATAQSNIPIIRIDEPNVSTTATATAAMYVPALSLGINIAAPRGTATAQANTPTVTAVRNVSQSVTPATATAQANAPQVGITVSIASPRLIATAQANVPTIRIDEPNTSTTATATAAMYAPTVVASINISNSVTPATASAMMHIATFSTAANASVVATPATATSMMRAPGVSGTALVVVTSATATAMALAPTVVAGVSTTQTWGTATASAMARPPTLSIGINQVATPATATAVLLVPTIVAGTGNTQASGQATATASMPIPVIRIDEPNTSTTATATAAMYAPTVSASVNVVVPKLTATATGLTVTLETHSTIEVGTAQASASMFVPTWSLGEIFVNVPTTGAVARMWLPREPSLNPNTRNNFALYIKGWGSMLSSKLAYIRSTFPSHGFKDAYITGYDPFSLVGKTALRFEAIKQSYARIDNIAAYGAYNAFTLNMWVKPRQLSNGTNRGIIWKDGVMSMYINSTGNYFVMEATIGGVLRRAITPTYLLNRWYMLSMRYDGSFLYFYVNGEVFHTIAVSGTVATNSNPWYLGFVPTTSAYSDIDVSDVKLWNIAISASDVADMYEPPFRSACKLAYISSAEPTGISSSKRAYIYSNVSASNPISITSSQVVEFARQAVGAHKSAFIVAGGENTTVFDTRIQTDFTTEKSWDNIIAIRGNAGRFSQRQLGNVVYPITRIATQYIRIPTSYDPNIDRVHKDCWLMTYNSVSSTRGAYIHVKTPHKDFKQAFISGPFTVKTDTHPCYISNSEIHATKSAFIEGTFVLSYRPMQLAFVNGYSDNELGNKLSYVAGSGPVRSSKAAFIYVGTPTRGRKMAYLHAPIISTKGSMIYAYMKANVGIRRSKNCFVFGNFVATSTKSAYVVARPTSTASKFCFIQSQNPHRGMKDAFVRGRQSMTVSKSAYIKADINLVSSKTGYIKGYQGAFRVVWCYIPGPALFSMSGSKLAFVVNNSPVAVKHAFIVTERVPTKDCYIVSGGNATRTKSAYIAG
jgi:hypothetical protein